MWNYRQLLWESLTRKHSTCHPAETQNPTHVCRHRREERLIQPHHTLLQNKSTRVKEKMHKTDMPNFASRTGKIAHFCSNKKKKKKKEVASLQNYLATCPDCCCGQQIRQSSHKDWWRKQVKNICFYTEFLNWNEDIYQPDWGLKNTFPFCFFFSSCISSPYKQHICTDEPTKLDYVIPQ